MLFLPNFMHWLHKTLFFNLSQLIPKSESWLEFSPAQTQPSEVDPTLIVQPLSHRRTSWRSPWSQDQSSRQYLGVDCPVATAHERWVVRRHVRTERSMWWQTGTRKLRRITPDWFAGIFITIWVTSSSLYFIRGGWFGFSPMTKPAGVSIKHPYFYIKNTKKASMGCLEED